MQLYGKTLDITWKTNVRKRLKSLFLKIQNLQLCPMQNLYLLSQKNVMPE